MIYYGFSRFPIYLWVNTETSLSYDRTRAAQRTRAIRSGFAKRLKSLIVFKCNRLVPVRMATDFTRAHGSWWPIDHRRPVSVNLDFSIVTRLRLVYFPGKILPRSVRADKSRGKRLNTVNTGSAPPGVVWRRGGKLSFRQREHTTCTRPRHAAVSPSPGRLPPPRDVRVSIARANE